MVVLTTPVSPKEFPIPGGSQHVQRKQAIEAKLRI
jgi:hypothetical protein